MAKSLEEKILEIKTALEEEDITTSDINSHADNAAFKRILNGRKVFQKTADRLLAKIKRIRKKRKETSAEIPLGVKEVDIESVIDKDLTQNFGSQSDNMEGDAHSIKELPISSLEVMITNLKAENEQLKQENLFLKGELELKHKNKQKSNEQSKIVIEHSATVADKEINVIELLKSHEEMIKEVIDRVGNLERQFAIERYITSKEKNPGHHGFSISKLSSGYWQAVRRINGTPQCVYIGKNPALAQEKIEKWLKKHHPDILMEDTSE